MLHEEPLTRPPRERRAKTAAEALAALMRLASRTEKSSGDALRLMRTWGVPDADRAGVLDRLVREGFVDDRRYAEAFVREKSRLNGWGPRKIAATLRTKGIAQTLVDEALAALDPAARRARLDEVLRRALRGITYKNTFDLKAKLLRRATALGYDFGTAREAVDEAVRRLDPSDSDPCDEPFFF